MSIPDKPSWLLGPASGPIDPDVSRRIDALRIVLIGLIVLAHGGKSLLVMPERGPVAEWVLEILNRNVDFTAVPLFFTLSGYLFLRRFELSRAAYGEMLKKKFASILIPYLVFNIGISIWLLIFGSLPMIGTATTLRTDGIVVKTLGLFTLPINYPLWFLRDLLVVFLLSPVLLLFFKEIPRVGLVVLFTAWAAGSPGAYSLSGNAFAFYLGGYLARSGVDLSDTRALDRLVLPLFPALTLLLALHHLIPLPPDVQAFVFKCNMMLGVAFFWCLSRRSWFKGSRILSGAAPHSFFVYLAHEPTISIVQTRILEAWTPTGDPGQTLFYFGTGFFVIGFLWALGALLARIAPQAYGLITGSRRPHGGIAGKRRV